MRVSARACIYCLVLLSLFADEGHIDKGGWDGMGLDVMGRDRMRWNEGLDCIWAQLGAKQAEQLVHG